MSFHLTGVPSFCSLCNDVATSWLIREEDCRVMGRCVTHTQILRAPDRRFLRADSLKEVEVILVQRS